MGACHFNATSTRAGASARRSHGLILLIAGLVMLFAWALPAARRLRGVSGLVLVRRAFAVFEACAGWCAVRAMGFKTRL
jgi:uncharacterized membrane protein